MSEIQKTNTENCLLTGRGKNLFPVMDSEVDINKAVAQISEVSNLFKVWNRSHSDVMWQLMNLDHVSDTRNLRQIGAELGAKRTALVEAHFAGKENLLQAQIYEEEAEKETGAKRELLLLKAIKEKAHYRMKQEAILGATKDINILKASYDKLMGDIIKKYGKFDESVFEQEEKAYWIKRLYIQAMRDVRECGRIRGGGQRDLEQLGIDPTEALKFILCYIEQIEKHLSAHGYVPHNAIGTFLDSLVSRHINRVEELLTKKGVETSHLTLEDQLK